MLVLNIRLPLAVVTVTAGGTCGLRRRIMSTNHQWECGQATPTYTTICKFVSLLRCTDSLAWRRTSISGDWITIAIHFFPWLVIWATIWIKWVVQIHSATWSCCRLRQTINSLSSKTANNCWLIFGGGVTCFQIDCLCSETWFFTPSQTMTLYQRRSSQSWPKGLTDSYTHDWVKIHQQIKQKTETYIQSLFDNYDVGYVAYGKVMF